MNTKSILRSQRPESGAVATIVVVLLAAGVLLGFTAVAVDVGRTVVERRELQNGADAGAMALAQYCAKGNCLSNPGSLSSLVNANADDFEHQIAQQCGSATSGMPTPCIAPPSAITDIRECSPLPASASGLPYVEVRTRTRTQGGGSALQNVFGGAAGGTPTSTVDACARAAWGSPGSTGVTFPMTLGVCDWNNATAAGTKFAPAPPYSPAPAVPRTNSPNKPPNSVTANVVKIYAHENGQPNDSCGPSMDTPGGYGWLDDTQGADDCTATYGADGTVGGKPGGSPTQGCKGDGMDKWLGKEVLLPIFTVAQNQGQNTLYTLAGVSSFYFVGYENIPTTSDYGVYKTPTGSYCGSGGNKKSCIWGWFTSPILPIGTLNGSVPPRGPASIQLVG